MKMGVVGMLLAALAAAQATAQPCTRIAPCDVSIAFLTTKRAQAEFETGAVRYARRDAAYAACRRRETRGACYFAQVANGLAAELAQAFVASGVAETGGGSVRLTALPIWSPNVDSEPLQQAAKSGAAAFVGEVMSSLDEDDAAQDALTRANLVVVFQEYRSGGRCTYNALQSGRYAVLSACLANDPRGLLVYQFLHEIGHAFGAGHSRDAKLQPCTHPYACAFKYESKKGGFCTLTGQWDQTLRNGCSRLGYVKEYSHPGECTTRPGVPCGSERENDARRVRECLIPIARERRACDPW